MDLIAELKVLKEMFGKACCKGAAYVGETRFNQNKSQISIQECDMSSKAHDINNIHDLEAKTEL